MRFTSLLLGTLFGFLLSRVRATDYDAIAGMFRLQDLHLMGVIGIAVGVSALGLWLLRRSGVKALNGQAIAMNPRPMKKGMFAAGLVFGIGWALSGACPGTALAQIGEGKLYGILTTAGILAGTWMYGALTETRRAAAAPQPKEA
jgi:hypothetical protein